MKLDSLFEIQLLLSKSYPIDFKRYLYSQINWKSRLIGIVGARGVGKTTLLFQYLSEQEQTFGDSLYISADHVLLSSYGLFTAASDFVKMGGKLLLIDEIHKYPNWGQELKNIYDSFPSLRIVFSGSSALDIIKGKKDLSRRAVIYPLKGLSFREYLGLSKKIALQAHKLDDLLKKQAVYSSEIVSQTAPLASFREYLQSGYYPFFLEGTKDYHLKLDNCLEKIIYEDIPSVYGIRPSSIPVLKKMICLVASSQPFVPNIDKMSSELRISKEYTYYYLDCLERAGVFIFLRSLSSGYRQVRKPEKIYMENPNLIYSILSREGWKAEIGSVRETFFMNQFKGILPLYSTDLGDFQTRDKIIFEIGGKNKKTKWNNDYLILDDIEVGLKNRIPLWLFGFLY